MFRLAHTPRRPLKLLMIVVLLEPDAQLMCSAIMKPPSVAEHR
jgi:hypothetical protein